MNSDQAKLFVGGISWLTNEETLKHHFNKYGTVLGSVIAKDRYSGAPRGFGFVWFAEPSSADRALQDSHVIVGRSVEVKRAIPRSEQHQNPQQHQQSSRQQNRELGNSGSNGISSSEFRTKKIFVGGLAADLTLAEFKNYFEKFGSTVDVVVMHDTVTQRPRGFGFITFESEDSVENVLQNSFHELNGKNVEVKKAVPKEGNNNCSNGYSKRGGGGGGGGGGNSSPFNSNYQHMNYSSCSPTIFPGASGYFYGFNTYASAYPVGAYGGMGMPLIPVRSSWSGSGTFGVRGYPWPVGSAAIFPPPMNGGFGSAANVGYDGSVVANSKSSQVLGCDAQVPVGAVSPRINGGNSDVCPQGSKGSCGAAFSETGSEIRVTPCPAGDSS